MAQIEAARARLEGLSMVSPLVACNTAPAGKTVRLKLENLQPIGSFKIRPIGNAVLARAPSDLAAASTPPARATARSAWPGWRAVSELRATAIVPDERAGGEARRAAALGTRIDMRRRR